MLDSAKLAFIGSGAMSEAMIKGLLRQKLIPASNMIAAGPREERGHQLEKLYQVNWTTDNQHAVKDRDVVVLGIKPQAIKTVLPELHNLIPPSTLVISIAAGVPIQRITNGLDHESVVRAMPNTPGQIGEGITVWTSTEDVLEEQLEQTSLILGAMGQTIHVEEEHYLDMATALSGTGPAYILLIMEAMIDAGVHLGFSRRVAEQLVHQTMLGTVKYAEQSNKHPATLRNEVTSPGGTSAEALYHLESGGLRTVFAKAIWAAYQRSVALGNGKYGPHLAGRKPEDPMPSK